MGKYSEERMARALVSKGVERGEEGSGGVPDSLKEGMKGEVG